MTVLTIRGVQDYIRVEPHNDAWIANARSLPEDAQGYADSIDEAIIECVVSYSFRYWRYKLTSALLASREYNDGDMIQIDIVADNLSQRLPVEFHGHRPMIAADIEPRDMDYLYNLVQEFVDCDLIEDRLEYAVEDFMDSYPLLTKFEAEILYWMVHNH